MFIVIECKLKLSSLLSVNITTFLNHLLKFELQWIFYGMLCNAVSYYAIIETSAIEFPSVIERTDCMIHFLLRRKNVCGTCRNYLGFGVKSDLLLLMPAVLMKLTYT
jgi:hypothetical protein